MKLNDNKEKKETEQNEIVSLDSTTVELSSIVSSKCSIVNTKNTKYESHNKVELRSIGTLGEKVLHAILKQYYEPDETRHEIKVGSFIADIVSDEGIIEIQTRSFDKLRKKLTEFLQFYPVTVVYPLPKKKWLIWIDEETGEATKKRLSPKLGFVYDAFQELYKIKPFLKHPNFHLCIVLINMEEYRYLDGWSKDKKKGSTRCNRIPIDITDEVYFNKNEDYLQFIPDCLNDGFTSMEYKSATRLSLRNAQTGLNILHDIGAVTRIGKQGKLYVYKRT